MEDRYLRYRHLNLYLKEIFGERTLKICINGNFTCPNRDGKCGYGGCIFCSENGSGDQLKNTKAGTCFELVNSQQTQKKH